jgi:hypothetical protein
MSNTLRDVAESTLHTVADFVDDAYHSIDLPKLHSIDLPKLEMPRRRKSSVLPALLIVGLALAVIAVVLKLVSSTHGGPTERSADTTTDSDAARGRKDDEKVTAS